MAKIQFSSKAVFEIPDEIDLLQAYRLNPAIPLRFGCTQGKCGVCAFHAACGQEHLSPPTNQEKLTLKERLNEGYRLACQCAILGDIKIS